MMSISLEKVLVSVWVVSWEAESSTLRLKVVDTCSHRRGQGEPRPVSSEVSQEGSGCAWLAAVQQACRRAQRAAVQCGPAGPC